MLKKIVILLLLCTTFVFAFEINTIRFDEEVSKGKKVSKTFSVGNNSEKVKVYKLAIEGDKNVKVKPNAITIKPFERKEFTIEVNGKKKGENQYYLMIKEIKTSVSQKENEEGIELLKTIKILQKYTVK
ncbi:hypothetical protein [Fusobacterium mortiferum]|uniref:hypothetical protein n=1 Tax=Fusobacterium mortiferum TaxID=850 RepID=UPI003F8DE032